MKHFSLSALIITITAGLTVCTGSCDSRRWRSTQGCVWSTTYHVTYRGKNDLSDSILATMSRVEKSLSPFDKGSVISLINRNESDRCDSLVAIVTAASRRVWSASGGKFDPTIAPAVIAPDAMTADALATACMAMEAEAAMAMIEREHDAEAMIVTSDSTAANGMKIMSSKGFPL